MLDHNADTSMYTCYYCYHIHKYLILNMHKLSRHLTSIAYLFVVIKAIIALLSSMLTPEVVCCYNELTAILGNHVRRTFLTNTDLVHCRKLWEWKKTPTFSSVSNNWMFSVICYFYSIHCFGWWIMLINKCIRMILKYVRLNMEECLWLIWILKKQQPPIVYK